MRYLLLFILLLGPVSASADNRERTVCGFLKERLYFSLWSSQAPARDPDRVTLNPLVEAVEFVTDDQRTLRGYRYRAHNEDDETVEPKGYLLVAMGNAMVSDQMISTLAPYARAGFNAYVFDYRGYADSEGRRRINAIVKDYEEIISNFSEQYSGGLLYGTSLGGLVILNAISEHANFTRAVIDSSPSRLSDHGCPQRLDAINHVTEDNASKLFVITGARDRVLNDSMTAPLRQRADEVGARTHHGEQFDHPFMDAGPVHQQRQQLIFDFLTQEKEETSLNNGENTPAH
ncbi:alpha/beta hydrolase [Aliidiomarina indica]|uniref:alpha/beta hydrolase n=1 Tax=Aliidiomarina indica TaxID=2749147 RepID=UPI00188E67BC|nr:alpha/beta hydrolase [Aliidiomarina indica]